MPIVAHNDLPTYQRLSHEGNLILSPERAEQQDIRPLHVGLLNMMPDAAMAATERQFFRLVGSSNTVSQYYMHPFTLDAIPRSDAAREHIARYYESFDDLKQQGLDALIISGANVTEPHLDREIFWEPLAEVMDWADQTVASTLCSCLATHALLLYRYGVRRTNLPQKRWGVFEHEILRRDHPLVQDTNTRIVVPHSRFNEISAEAMKSAGLQVLASGDEAGVQLAVSPDGFRTVFFQGHPEYDPISLMKEYKRDLLLYATGKKATPPPFPEHYFDTFSQHVLREYLDRLDNALQNDQTLPPFPEHLLIERLHNTWHDSGEAIIGNWIGLVYQVTHVDRAQQYMDGVDPDNPLQLP